MRCMIKMMKCIRETNYYGMKLYNIDLVLWVYFQMILYLDFNYLESEFLCGIIINIVRLNKIIG